MILAIGEILTDNFIENDKKTTLPGGAPFNVACNIKAFGGDIAFMGAIGKDEDGKLLEKFANKKLDNLYLKVLNDRATTQAIVTLDNGERSFRFNRSNGADYHLEISQLNDIDFTKVKIVHIGSLMLSTKEGFKFFFDAIKYIRSKSNCLISFDVNYRDDIFPNEDEAKKVFISAINEADILKFTEEELELLSGEKDLRKGLGKLLNPNQVAVVSLGKDGSVFYSKNKFTKVETYPLKPVDTTGAGDAFYSYFLFAIDNGLNLDDESVIRSELYNANLIGGLATQKKGAINVVPTLSELECFKAKISAK